MSYFRIELAMYDTLRDFECFLDVIRKLRRKR